MADLINRVTTIYRADTAQAQHAVRAYRGVEQVEAKKVLDGLNAQNAALQGQLATFAKVGAAIGGVAIAYKAAMASAKAYLEDQRLAAAAAGADIDRLNEATLGLIETDKLMAFAGKAQAGVWKLNQQEMESVLKGATALRKTMGVELEPTIDKLTEALAKGSTRALKEFGIEAKDKQDAVRQLDALFKSLGGNVGMAGDELGRAEKGLKDAIDDLKGSFGELVIALAPVISGLSSAVGLINDAIAGWKILFGGEGPWHAEHRRTIDAINKQSNDAVSQMMGDSLRKEIGARLHVWARFNPDQAGLAKGILDELAKGPARSTSQGRGARSSSGKIDVLDLSGFGDSDGDTLLDSLKAEWAGERGDAAQRDLMAQVASIQGARIASDARASKQDGERRTYLETVFGTPAEIDAMTESLKVAASVFEGFSQAVVAGFDAWITGQESASAAFAKAVGEMLRSLAKQMAVESMKHGAMALGALAIGGPFGGKTAAEHGAAAAAFAGVAAAAGVAAKGVGSATGQWSRGGSGGVATARDTSSARMGGGGDTGNAPIVVYVGSEVAGMSAIERADYILKAVEVGKRGNQHIRRH